jgi:hypothetical protein
VPLRPAEPGPIQGVTVAAFGGVGSVFPRDFSIITVPTMTAAPPTPYDTADKIAERSAFESYD